MPLEDMVSVLVKMGILQELRKPVKHLSAYAGPMNYLGTAYSAAGAASLRRCFAHCVRALLLLAAGQAVSTCFACVLVHCAAL